MLVDDLTVSGLLKVLREMQADKLTCDQINEISGEDLSTLVQNLSDISDKLSTIQSTIDQCETDASTFKTGIADAIKGVDSTATVTGDSSLPDFTSGIQNIVPNVTSDATATAGHILKDKTAYVNGNKVTGTIASKTAATYTPGTSNQIIAAGQYLSGAQTIAGDVDLVAENIKTGVNIFGVDGTFTSDATAVAGHILSGKTAYVNGSKVTGTMAYNKFADHSPVATDFHCHGTTYSENNGSNTFMLVPQGYYDGSTWLGCNTEIKAENIRAGVKIGTGADEGAGGVTGTFTSDATATEYDIARDKIAYVNGNKITGAIKTIAKDSSYKSFGSISKSSTNDKYMDFRFGGVLSDGVTGTLFRDGSKLSIYVSDHTALGTVSADKVLAGETFTSTRGVCLTGTMNNYSGVETPRGATANITSVVKECNIDVGGYYGIVSFHPCFTGYIDANTVINQIVYGLNPNVIKAGQLIGAYGGSGDSAITGTFTSDANAAAEYIAYGKTAYVNGSKITGKLTNYSGSYMLGNINIISTNTGGPSNIVRMSYSVPSSSSGFYVPSNSSFFLYADKSVLGDAVASSVLSGSTFTSSSGLKVAGTMNNYGGQTIAGDLTEADGSVVKFRVTTGGYCSGTTKISRPYSTVASALGITASKIAKGYTICGVAGTYTGGYQCAQWSVEIEPDKESSYFNVLGGNLSSTTWRSACTSSASSQFCAYWSAVDGKLNGSTWAVCKISAPTYGIRRGNGYSANSSTGSYRYLSSITIVADELTTGTNTTYHGTTAGMGSKTILIGHWYDCNLAENSTSTHKSCNIDFYIEDDGYVLVSFYHSGANTLAFRGKLRFDFQVFYK